MIEEWCSWAVFSLGKRLRRKTDRESAIGPPHQRPLDQTGVGLQANAQTAVQKLPASTASASVVATNAEPLKVLLLRKKVVIAAGQESLESADAVKPGDIIEESATYTNTSDKLISKFVAQLPVPSNTEFIANSAKPTAATASMDGAQYAAIPLMRRVANPKNGAVEMPIPLTEYRFLRWQQGEIAPGKALRISARFRVLANDLNTQAVKTNMVANSAPSEKSK